MAKSNRDDVSRQTAADRLINEAREHLQAVRNQFWRERVNGNVTQHTKRELAIAALQVYDVLFENRDEDVIRGEWEDSSIPQLESLLAKTVTKARPAPGDTANGDSVQVPAIMAVDADRLLAMTKDLDEIAKNLGHGATIEHQRPMYDAGKLDPEDYDEPVSEDIPKPQ